MCPMLGGTTKKQTKKQVGSIKGYTHLSLWMWTKESQCMQHNPLPNIRDDSLNVALYTKQFDVYLACPADAVDMGYLCSECTMVEKFVSWIIINSHIGPQDYSCFVALLYEFACRFGDFWGHATEPKFHQFNSGI